MEMSLVVIIAFLVVGVVQETRGLAPCPGSHYYNETRKECCAACPPGFEKRRPCVKDKRRDCREACPDGYFINWDAARCQSCTQCSHDADLIEIRPCSGQANAVCTCRPGLYCKTPLENTCARCKPHSRCRAGYGVKRQGDETRDTVCERCPPDSSSASDQRTGCAKLNSPSIDADSTNNRRRDDPGGSKRSTGEPPNNHSAPTTPLYPRRATAHSIPAAAQTKSSPTTHSQHFSLATTNIANEDSGEWHPLHVLAGCICVAVLIASSLLVWKQKGCKMKPLLITQNGFAPYKSHWKRNAVVLKFHEESKEEELLGRENSSPERRDSVAQKDKARERDHLTNRIEKIYIMKADTVLVGSITDAPKRQVTISSDGETGAAAREEAAVFATRYPQQESSTEAVNDLRISVEEEAAKNGVDPKNDSSALCV